MNSADSDGHTGAETQAPESRAGSASPHMHGVAVDAGSGLEATLKTLRGDAAAPTDLLTFKRAVLEELGAGATTVLVDAALGPQLIGNYPNTCEPMLAFEADVYHISDDERITKTPADLSIADYATLGVKQLKFFMYYAPDDVPELNDRKLDIIEGIGKECVRHGLTYLLEPLVYHPELKAGTAEYALRKPDLVRRATERFAEERFCATVLKVEVPVDLDFVDGFGDAVMSQQQAIDAFAAAAEPAAHLQLVYLSAGVSFERFEASLQMARDASVPYSGFMCGRALWSDAMSVFGEQGEASLRSWLATTGRARLAQLIQALP